MNKQQPENLTRNQPEAVLQDLLLEFCSRVQELHLLHIRRHTYVLPTVGTLEKKVEQHAVR